MKDKKFAVLVFLAVIWAILFIGMAMGELRIGRNAELFVTFILVAWFAFWTICTLRDYRQKKKIEWTNPQPIKPEPITEKDIHTHAYPKKTPKSSGK